MSAQSPRIPSPADLARARRPPAPPPPSRGRRLAEIEKERAQRALRALVTDPATDFTALDADEFFAALRCAGPDGTVNPALIAEVGRRLADGTAAAREVHQVLFAAGDDPGWEQARGAATAAVGRRPHLAVEVLTLEVQRLGTPPIRVTETAGAGGFTARAALERDGVTIEGQPCSDTSKKRAGQGAAMSLLTALTGIPVPALGGHSGPASAGRPASGPASGPVTPAIDPTDLEAWLDHVVSRPEPDPELADHLAAGHLTVRSLHLLLFEARPRGWRRHRARAWAALVSTPSQAPGVLSMHTQARSWPPAGYAELGERTALAYVNTPEGPVVGEPAVAAGIKAARAAAAVALIRDLAPPTQGADAVEVPPPAGNPVGLLNERAQIGVIADLTYTQDATGPAHRPVFTCTARCLQATDAYAASAEADSKNEAKTAAAAGLLDQILSAERTYRARLAQARREQARSPEGIFARLLRAGFPMEFTGSSLRIGGHLPEPLAGTGLPVRSALPVLVSLDADLDGPVHPSARTWASAARTALEAIAARRVYPALDSDGRDCWRLALSDAPDPAVAGFLDVIADTMLRPAGARLVVGDRPYAGPARRLDPEATAWADRVAEAAEGTTATPVVIRLSPPDGDGLPLRAELRDGATGVVRPGGDPFDAILLGRAQERLLRRAGRDWPALERVRLEGTLSGAEAAQLLGPAGEKLAALGITAEWPADLVTASGLAAQIIVGPGTRSGSSAFSLTDVTELTWQLSLDGEPLTDEETEAAAETVAGVIRIRGRWVVIDAPTRRQARDRHAGRLTGAQALEAALTGQVRIGGRDVTCSGTGRLADLIATLRGASSGPPDRLAIPAGLNATLRGYQRVAVQWLTRTTAAGFGALLADDMGLGKTLTVIAFLLTRKNTRPSLVICPASLVVNWEREFARFAPEVTVRRYHASGRTLDGLAPGEVVVTTYGTLLRDAEILAQESWDLVVADEAQQVKNHRSQAARAVRGLRSTARIAVTGTPVENSLSELWAILDWTNPGLFGSLSRFRERFARAAEQEGAGGLADRDAAHRLGRLIAPFVLRRRKTDPDIAPELPDKVLNDRYVELSREQAALYQAATAATLDRIAASDGQERRGQVLRLLQSLRQICNSPAHYLRESPHDWDAARQAARSGKLEVLEELMDAVVRTGDAALIFTGYVSMGHLIRAHLAARGLPAEFLHGGVPIPTRQKIVDRFQAGEGHALILSIQAAGTGLNLTRAGHVIHFDRPWNPAVEDQATDRAHRIGQHRLVEVHHLIAEGTVEDRIAALLTRKRELTEAVLPGGKMALTELSDRDLSALVSLSADLSTEGDRA